MNATEVWVRSGLAAEAAKDIAWFVVIVFIVIGYCAWKDRG